MLIITLNLIYDVHLTSSDIYFFIKVRVKKAFSQIYVDPNLLEICKARSHDAGKFSFGTNFQNFIKFFEDWCCGCDDTVSVNICLKEEWICDFQLDIERIFKYYTKSDWKWVHEKQNSFVLDILKSAFKILQQ